MDLLDHVDARVAIDDRIHDEDIRDTLLDSDSQVVPATGCRERVLRAKNDCEVRKELAREVRYDVHMGPDRMS